MNGNVIIKSFPNGISVRLSDKADFEKILQDTRTSFEKTASFFKNASIVLRFEGRELSDDEIEALTNAILEVSQINIICVVCTNQEENTYFSKCLDEIRKQAQDKNSQKTSGCFEFYKGSLTDGFSLETDGNIIVLGNVEKGAAIFAKGNVIVLGTIYGTVFAGKKEDESRFIAALEFSAENLKIGKIKYRKEKRELFTLNKKQPKIAYIKDGKFTFSELDFTKELPEYQF